MKTYISMLRGINVGGHNLINMKDLKQMYEAMKFKNVRTYLQSGNVVFSYNDLPDSKISGMIEKQIEKSFGLIISVIIRNTQELEKIIASNPFLKKGKYDFAKIAVLFLNDLPDKELAASLQNPSANSDEFYISGKEIYLNCPDGLGRTKLNSNFFERKLKLITTGRNWNTICALFEMGKEK